MTIPIYYIIKLLDWEKVKTDAVYFIKMLINTNPLLILYSSHPRFKNFTITGRRAHCHCISKMTSVIQAIQVGLQEHQSSKPQDHCLLKHWHVTCLQAVQKANVCCLKRDSDSETVAYWTRVLGNCSFPLLCGHLLLAVQSMFYTYHFNPKITAAAYCFLGFFFFFLQHHICWENEHVR